VGGSIFLHFHLLILFLFVCDPRSKKRRERLAVWREKERGGGREIRSEKPPHTPLNFNFYTTSQPQPHGNNAVGRNLAGEWGKKEKRKGGGSQRY